MNAVLERADLARLFDLLRDEGYDIIGPTLCDDAIVYAEISGPEDLPVGWTDEQSPGRYRLVRRDDEAAFGYAVGPHSWKRELFPSREVLHRTARVGETLHCETASTPPARRAFIGVRACEIAAMKIQDRVFVGGAHIDPRYAARREAALIVAVNCGEPSGLCFCVSMNTGPRVEDGADIVLTELPDRFIVLVKQY